MTTRRLSYVVLLTWLSGCGGSASSTSDRDGGPTGGRTSSTGGTGGSSSGGTGGAPGSTLTADNFPMAFEDALCSPDVACQVYTSMAACEAAMWFAESTQVLTQVAGVHSGKVRFDATAAAECLAALPTYCFQAQDQVGSQYLPLDVFNSIAVCFQVFTGLLPPGSPCGLFSDCAFPANCGPAYSFMGCGPGTCTYVDGGVLAFPTLGEACSTSCAPPAVCVSGTCVMLAGEGGACHAGGCGRLDDFCKTNQTGGSGVCQRRLADGGDCGDLLTTGVAVDNPCILTDGCDGPGSPLTCAAGPTLGEPCNAGFCDAGLICTFDPPGSTQGTCTARPSAAACLPAGSS